MGKKNCDDFDMIPKPNMCVIKGFCIGKVQGCQFSKVYNNGSCKYQYGNTTRCNSSVAIQNALFHAYKSMGLKVSIEAI